jgi:hypothetical protein
VLTWTGVGALGCVAGIAISALAFLLLPGPGGTANGSLESHVASVIATAPPPATTFRGTPVPNYQMTEAEEKAEIPRWVRPSATAIPTVEPQDAEPAPEPAPSAVLAVGDPAGPGETTHVVEEGETLWHIAADNGMKVGDLAARNGLPEDALIMTGDVLVIPAATVDNQP